jgi:putative flippase GtrA
MPRERWQKISGEFAKFGTIGVINAVINYTVFNALVLTIFTQSQLKANVVATVVAATASFFMNRHWTYRDRPRSALQREYLLFFIFNAVGLSIELGVLGLTKYGFGLTSLLALNIGKTFGVALGTAFRFWAYRTFVFPAPPRPSAAPAQPAQAEEAAAQPALSLRPAQPAQAAPSPAADYDLDAEFAAGIEAELDAELDRPLRANAVPRRR